MYIYWSVTCTPIPTKLTLGQHSKESSKYAVWVWSMFCVSENVQRECESNGCNVRLKLHSYGRD